MKLTDIKFNSTEYWCCKNLIKCTVVTSHPDDGACLIVEEKSPIDDVLNRLHYSESCYLSKANESTFVKGMCVKDIPDEESYIKFYKYLTGLGFNGFHVRDYSRYLNCGIIGVDDEGDILHLTHCGVYFDTEVSYKNISGLTIDVERRLVVFDLDSTLRDNTGDYSHSPYAKGLNPKLNINWEQWQRYVIEHGQPKNDICDIYRCHIDSGNEVVICTSSQFGTAEWLTKHNLPMPSFILERNRNDVRQGLDYKKDYIDHEAPNIKLWVDDHQETCDYVESLGIEVMRVKS